MEMLSEVRKHLRTELVVLRSEMRNLGAKYKHIDDVVTQCGGKPATPDIRRVRYLSLLHAAREILRIRDRIREVDHAEAALRAARATERDLRERIGALQSWNRCPQCGSIVDADEVHDGAELTCDDCRASLVVVASSNPMRPEDGTSWHFESQTMRAMDARIKELDEENTALLERVDELEREKAS